MSCFHLEATHNVTYLHSKNMRLFLGWLQDPSNRKGEGIISLFYQRNIHHICSISDMWHIPYYLFRPQAYWTGGLHILYNMFFFQCVILSILRYTKISTSNLHVLYKPNFPQKKTNTICVKINPDMKKAFKVSFSPLLIKTKKKKPQKTTTKN